MTRLPVSTDLPAYRAAAAQLSLTAGPRVLAPGDPVRGAVVVVPGVGPWWRAVLAARDGGAAAAVVVDPVTVPPEAGEVLAAPLGMPVVVDRARLRPDIAADALSARAGSRPAMVTVECAAGSSCFEAVLRDAFGWARTLGGRLDLRAASATLRGRLALLDAAHPPDAAVSATVLASMISGRKPGGLLKVLALGATRTEFTADQPAGIARLETATAAGVLVSPARYEAPARLALRRAAEACAGGNDPEDLAALLLDGELVQQLARI